ncbi:hypothetical protein GGS26DRAFT_594000 [Hypomontagnella submonticulosa]|nr:hypothetical protein GGS26DRAFT_594000 [Hypomontagnella submonticulosa]
MKTSFVLTMMATVLAMASAAPADNAKPPSVEDLFKSLKNPDPHGYSAILPDGRVVRYDSHHTIVDSKQADPKAIKEYWEADKKKAQSREVDAPVTPARRSEEEVPGLAERMVCGEYACAQDDLDCQAVGCYGGCRRNFHGLWRCYP